MTADEIRELSRQEMARYHREWRRKNPDKAKAIQDRYWAKKALQRENEQKQA